MVQVMQSTNTEARKARIAKYLKEEFNLSTLGAASTIDRGEIARKCFSLMNRFIEFKKYSNNEK